MTREKKILGGTGIAIAVVTLLTRFPIRSHTLFEFDSINFAVALMRFDLGQVTPQVPGYILHVLFGRVFYWFTGDENLAYLWLSLILSIGSVLFLWRAAATLRGERVGIIATLLWLTTPLFWFHGAVNAIYTEEAFYTSAILYCGIKWLRNEGPTWEVILYAIVLSLATGARQTSILFFLPATIVVFLRRRPSRRIMVWSIAAFILVSSAWLFELLRESGGLSTYLDWAKAESNFKTQSMLFGNSWSSQLDTIGKTVFYFIVALGPSCLLVLSDLVFFKRSIQFIRSSARTASGQFVCLVALAPLLFYGTVFFMKAGYLLNVLPSAILVGAILLDQTAIWLAEWQKRRTTTLLTRPIITRNVASLTGILVGLNVLWFFVPWPGTGQTIYDNEDTRNSFIHGAVHRYEQSQSQWLTLANRAFEYTNVSGIRAVDSLNDLTYRALIANGGNDSSAVVLASWWYRWAYTLLPKATVYDLEINPVHPDSLWVGRSNERHRVNVYDSVIRLHSNEPVLLLLRHDRPDFDTVARQVHLERIPLPEYLDIYRIEDSSFVLRWKNRIFIGNRN